MANSVIRMAYMRIKTLLELAANHEIIISGSAVGIAYITELAYGITVPYLVLFASVFLMMWAVYRVNKILDIKEDAINTPKRIKYKNKFTIWVLPVFAYIASLILVYTSSFWAFLVILISFFWILGYSIKLPKSIKNSIKYGRIKEIPIIKTVYASIAWCMLVLISTFMLNRSISLVTIAVFIIIFFKILIDEIGYDIRDVKGDKRLGIRTIPVVFGLKMTKQVLLFLGILAGLLPILFVYLHILPTYMLLISIMSIYVYYFIQEFDKTTDINFLCDVVIGGEYIVLAVLLFMGTVIFRL